MSHAPATAVPAESDWLCEGCGYVLNGLPAGRRCPECGKLISESDTTLRLPPLWEQPAAGSAIKRLLVTTGQVLFQPTRFYRSLATRGSRRKSLWFAHIHWLTASVLFGLAGWAHFDLMMGWGPAARLGAFLPWPVFIGLVWGTWVMLIVLTLVAARLTTWEATFRGLRLPLGVVRRGLDYHAAHYLPVALLAAATVIGYRLWLGHNPVRLIQWGTAYLYTRCGEVIICAVYLFKTYWIGMRNMMYASR